MIRPTGIGSSQVNGIRHRHARIDISIIFMPATDTIQSRLGLIKEERIPLVYVSVPVRKTGFLPHDKEAGRDY